MSFTSSTFTCYLFILFNFYISFHKDNLNMNKNNVYKTKVRKSKELLEFTLELKLSQFEFT